MPNEAIVPQQVPIELIHDLPDLPRVSLPDKAYGGLVTSILLDGIKSPLILRQAENGELQLVAGYRRRKAAELAKLKELPALVYEMTLKEAQKYHADANGPGQIPIPGKPVKWERKAQEIKTAPAEKKDEGKQTAAPAAPVKKEPGKTEKAAEAKPAPATDAKPEKALEKKPAKEQKEGKPDEKREPDPAAKAEKGQPDKEDKKETAKENKVTAAKAPAEKAEEKPTGKTAYGPTGTTITKLLGEKLEPPTDKDKKALPVPKEGETFSAVLHPAYLKKADINTFSVDRDSDDFKELYKSIERFGVREPVIARFSKDGELEIISGQRRHLIASELNYPVPTIIQQLDDDDARILVADGNLHREHISTYDLSRALRMKADSMKRKAGRKIRGVKTGPETDEIIAREMGMSTMKLNRLMKLSEATKQICDLVDDGTLAVSVAYNIAFLSPKHQDMVADLMGINVKVSAENTGNLKKYLKAGDSVDRVRDIPEGKYPPPKVVEIPRPVTPPPAPAAPPTAPASVPKSADIPSAPASPEPPKVVDQVVPYPANGPTPVKTAPTPAQPAVPAASPVPASSMAPKAPEAVKAEPMDRENTYETKIILRGDRLRKYFPDVSMTPREIEDSVYDALEERRQRQEKAKQAQAQKSDIFKKGVSR